MAMQVDARLVFEQAMPCLTTALSLTMTVLSCQRISPPGAAG
jgi:hypothetical protein